MDGISLHCNSMAGAHKLDAEKTICHGRYLDAVLGWFGGVSLKGFHVGGSLVEVATHLFLICHGRATPSLISSAYGFTCGPIFLSFFNCKALFLLFWVCFCFCFLERMWSCLILWVFCVFVSQENFWVYGLLEIGLVTVFMGLFLGFIYGLVSWIFLFLFFWIWWSLDLVAGFGFGVC